MTTPRIYLAGPMTGYELYNFPAFIESAKKIEDMGWKVISPAQLDIDRGFNPIEDPDAVFTDEMLMPAIRLDLEAVLSCQAIAMLDGWEKSTGATAEFHVAKWAKLELFRYYERLNQLLTISTIN